MIKNFISLDLEMNQPSGKICQIGAVVFTLEPFNILETLDIIVNPQEEITEYITKLTGITNEKAKNGPDLLTAYNKLCELKIKHNCESYPITWGGDDSKCLREQVNVEKFIFGRRFFDTKTLYQTYRLANGEKTQSGLSKSMAKCGLQFVGPKHDAKWDAFNTATFFKFLSDKMKNV